MRTLLRYPGGKSRAYNIISNKIPKLPYPTKIISPFLGGGSMESRWASEWNVPTYGFDLFEHLVNYWNVLLESPVELAEELAKIGPTQESYYEHADKLLKSSMTQRIMEGHEEEYPKRVVPKDEWLELSNLENAAIYLQNFHLSYGPAFLGYWMELNSAPEKWSRFLEKVRNYKNPDLHVELLSVEKVIPQFPNDLIYLDPPYYLEQDGGNKMAGGLYPAVGMAIHHDYFDHELMRDQLHNHKGPFILSYNDCPTIREYYKDFQQEFPVWHYSYQQGQKGIQKESHEILILKDVEV